MHTNQEWVELVNKDAESRGEPPLPPDLIIEAVDRALNGIIKKNEIGMYPTGMPTLKFLYDTASELRT